MILLGIRMILPCLRQTCKRPDSGRFICFTIRKGVPYETSVINICQVFKPLLRKTEYAGFRSFVNILGVLLNPFGRQVN